MDIFLFSVYKLPRRLIERTSNGLAEEQPLAEVSARVEIK